MGGKNRYRFGIFEVDFSTGELRRKGMRVRIQKKPLELLEVLVHGAGSVVSREELRRALWPGDVFVGFDHGLNVAATKLRRVLGEAAAAPRYFETVRGEGFRFISPLESLDDVGGNSIPRLAISSFAASEGDVEAKEFRHGLHEELLTELGRIGASSLRVVGNTSVRRLDEVHADASEIGKELDVSFVLEGSVRSSESGRRVNVRLVDVPDNSVVWSDRFDFSGDRWAAELEAASVIANLVVRQVGGIGARGSREQFPAVVRRARQLGASRSHADMLAALAMLEDAASRNEHDSRIQSALATILNTVAEYGLRPPGEAYLRSREAAERAVRLDPESAEAHAALGVVAHRFGWQWSEAERCYRRAIECNPSDVGARQAFAEFLSQMQRHDEAIVEVREARRLDPLSAVVNAIEAWILFHSGQLDEALSTAEVALAHDAESPLAHFVKGRVLVRQGHLERAVTSMERAVVSSGESPHTVAGLAIALARAGRRSRAAAVLGELEVTSSVAVSPYLIAKVHCALGNLDRAFELMWRGVEQRTGWLADLDVDPEISPMRRDPRFAKLRERVGLPG